MQQRHGGYDFKVRWTVFLSAGQAGFLVHHFYDWPDAIDQFDQFVWRARVTVDGNSFFDAVQMRRREESRAMAGSREYRANHGGGGPLSLRARNMDDGQLLLWVP